MFSSAIEDLEKTFTEFTGQASTDWQASEHLPDYFCSKFHAYSEGNLCWDAALEQMVAGKGVGVRNFPEMGPCGEDHMRGLHEDAMVRMGAFVPAGSTIVDMGCGTGTSSRRLAARFPQAVRVIGLDLSPHFLTIASRVPEVSLLPAAEQDASSRVEYMMADIADTGLAAGSAAMVSVCLVIHELPAERTAAVFREAYRILAPGGTMSVMEMDPEAPGFERLRSNALLFSLIRSTEPFLDQYFELASDGRIEQLALDAGFALVRREAATGRHFTMMAMKGGVADHRWLSPGKYAQPDTHM